MSWNCESYYFCHKTLCTIYDHEKKKSELKNLFDSFAGLTQKSKGKCGIAEVD